MRTLSFAISCSTDKNRLRDLRDRKARLRAFHMQAEKPFCLKRISAVNVSGFSNVADGPIPERPFRAVTTTEASTLALASV
jgi:hypothetical protein